PGRRLRGRPGGCRMGAARRGARLPGARCRHAACDTRPRRAPCRRRPACARPAARMTIAVIPIPGLPMVRPGDDLARLLGDAIADARVGLKARDVVAVCQKVVSKAEGSVVSLDEVVASPFAERLAAQTEGGKDPRAMEVVLREARRIVRMDHGHVIVETRHGWVCANAGVDESNGAAAGLVMEKDSGVAAAVVRGVRYTPGHRGAAAAFVRKPEFDLFR